MIEEARVLDSSVVIRHFRRGGEFSERLESYSVLYLPTIALGELYSGAYRSARPAKNLAQIAGFLGSVTILPVDADTASQYGQIMAELSAAGTPIPQNDAWIAACAMQWGLTLATSDAHFERVSGLKYDQW